MFQSNHANCMFKCYYRFLGYVDKIGTAYQSATVATGYGAHMAQVIKYGILYMPQ